MVEQIHGGRRMQQRKKPLPLCLQFPRSRSASSGTSDAMDELSRESDQDTARYVDALRFQNCRVDPHIDVVTLEMGHIADHYCKCYVRAGFLNLHHRGTHVYGACGLGLGHSETYQGYNGNRNN